MSTYGIFESIEGSEGERKIASRDTQRKLDAAIDAVRDQYGAFLYASRDAEEFNDRVALCKNDMIKTVDSYLMPVTGVMRRVVKACKDDWKQRTAGGGWGDVDVDQGEGSGKGSPSGSAQHYLEYARRNGLSPKDSLTADRYSREHGVPLERSRDYARKHADKTGPEMDIAAPFPKKKDKDLKPKGDFDAYLNKVDKNSDAAVDNCFKESSRYLLAADTDYSNMLDSVSTDKNKKNIVAPGASTDSSILWRTPDNQNPALGSQRDTDGNVIPDSRAELGRNNYELGKNGGSFGGGGAFGGSPAASDPAPAAAPVAQQSGPAAPVAQQSGNTGTGSGGSNSTGGGNAPGGAAPRPMTTGDVADGGRAGAENGNNAEIKGKSYIVQEGDTLTDIAQRGFGDMNKYDELAKANNITNPDQITVGQEIKSGDTEFGGNGGVAGNLTNPAGGGTDLNISTPDAGPASASAGTAAPKAEVGMNGLGTANGFAGGAPGMTPKVGSLALSQYIDWCDSFGYRRASINNLDIYAQNLNDRAYFEIASALTDPDSPIYRTATGGAVGGGASPTPQSGPTGAPAPQTNSLPDPDNPFFDASDVYEIIPAIESGTAGNWASGGPKDIVGHYVSMCRQANVRPTQQGFRNFLAEGRKRTAAPNDWQQVEEFLKNKYPEEGRTEGRTNDLWGQLGAPEGGNPMEGWWRSSQKRTAAPGAVGGNGAPAPQAGGPGGNAPAPQAPGDFLGAQNGKDGTRTEWLEGSDGSPLTFDVSGIPFNGHPTHFGRKRTAAPDYLQKADEALTNLLNQKAEEFQETIAPLQQALQTVQQAEQAQAAMNPLGVQPPAGTVNVLPQQPGGDPSGAAGGGDPSGGMDPAMMAQMMGGGGDPSMGGGDPSQMQMQARRRRSAAITDGVNEYPRELDDDEWYDEDFYDDNETYQKEKGKSKDKEAKIRSQMQMQARRRRFAYDDDDRDWEAAWGAPLDEDDPETKKWLEKIHRGEDVSPKKGRGANAPHHAGIVNDVDEWSKQRGVTTGNPEVDMAQFQSETGKPIGPKQRNKLTKPISTANPMPKSKSPITTKIPKPKMSRQASFFTRKVAGWEWDDHLNGYLANKPTAFTCKCGSKHPVPSYSTCKCGKIWNSYVIGTGGDHHQASVEKFICREVPVREGVIVANKRESEIIKYTEDEEEELPLKSASCNCWKGYERVPGTKPCAPGSCRKCDSHSKKESGKVKRHNLSDPGPLGDGKDDKMPDINEDLGKDWYKRGPGGKYARRKSR